MEIRRVHGSFEEMGAKVREQIAKYPELGTFEERRERHHGADDIGEFGPDEPERIKQMRKEGNKLAGRRGIDILGEVDNPGLIALTQDVSLDHIYERLANRTENAYLDFLARNFQKILEEIKTTYGSIPPVVRSAYTDIFAEEDEPHLIDTISRLRSFEVYTIYLKDRESDAMISFLERNFPHILIEIKAKHEIPMMASSSQILFFRISNSLILNPLIQIGCVSEVVRPAE